MPAEQKPKNFLFIVNPISGDIDKEELLAKIQQFAAENKLEVEIFKTSGDNDEKNLKKYIEDKKPSVVVAVGGDGTVNLAARQIVHTEIILAIIPMGSGNGLSKDLDIPQNDIDAALQVLVGNNLMGMDTLEVEGKFFMHLADIGFNAHIVKLFNKSDSRGLLSYMRFTLREFYNYKTSKYFVKTDDGSFMGKAFMITIANSNQFGSNLTINPNGACDDGFFEVIIIKRFPRKKALGLFFRMLFKRIDFSPYCVILKCREAEIICEKRKTLQFDGEIAGKVKSFKIKINPASLKVLVPETTEAI